MREHVATCAYGTYLYKANPSSDIATQVGDPTVIVSCTYQLHRASLPLIAPQLTQSRSSCFIEIMSSKPQLDATTPDSVWKQVLSPEEYRVLRGKGTEPAGTGKYTKFHDKGVYKCAGCGAPLYTSDQKFDSGCGWPAFYDEIPGALERHTDTSHGMKRVEIVCKNCGGHLGHVFEGEGFKTPTDQRHCVNSVSIKFDPTK